MGGGERDVLSYRQRAKELSGFKSPLLHMRACFVSLREHQGVEINEL